MADKMKAPEQYEAEIEELRGRLEEAEETLRAIQSGEVDALVVAGPRGNQVYTLKGEERTYRLLVESINEGAVILSQDGTVMYANQAFALMLGTRLERIIGSDIRGLVGDEDWETIDGLIQCGKDCTGTAEIHLRKQRKGVLMPAYVSLSPLVIDEAQAVSMIVTDLTERKEAEDLLRHYQEHLEELVQVRTEALQVLNEEMESTNEELVIANDEVSQINTELKAELTERTRVEGELRESEKRFRSVLDNSLDCIYRVNMRTGRYEYISPSSEKIVGFSPDELMSRDVETAFRLVHPDDTAATRATLARLEETGQEIVEYRQRAKDGSYRWISNHMHLTRDGDGRPLYRDGNIRDVTEQKQAEEELQAAHEQLQIHAEQLEVANEKVEIVNAELASSNTSLQEEIDERRRVEETLRESEQQFRAIFDSSQDAIVIADDNCIYTDANAAAKKVFGLPPRELIGRRIDDFMEPGYDCEGVWADFLKKGKIQIEHTLIGGDQKERTVESYWAANIMPGKHLIIKRDVTDRVLFEEQRKEIYEREHHIAEVLQKALVPDTDYHIPGLDIAVGYESALDEATVGGDFYDVFELGDNKVGILIGDVSGKGLAAAISVASARHSVRSYAYLDPRPARVLTLANDALCKSQTQAGSMVTAFFLVVDTKLGTITYANGGHESPLVRHADGSVDELEIGGRALAAFPDYPYPEGGRLLRPDDIVIMVTDGVTEARQTTRHFFGLEGAKNYVLQNPALPPAEIVKGLLNEAKQFAGGALTDDAAIVAFSLKPGSSRKKH